MQKIVLVALLAVCVASSVQGYVKRDAPAAPATEVNYSEKLKEALNDISAQIGKAFNPEDIKKQFDETMKTISKGIEDIRKQVETKPEPAKP